MSDPHQSAPPSGEPAPETSPPAPPAPPEHPLILRLRALDRGIATAESALLSLALLALIGVAVYSWYTFKIAPPQPEWTGDLVCDLVFFIGLIGGALAVQEQRVFNMDLISHFLPPRAKLVSRLLIAVFVVVMCVFMVKGGLYVRNLVAGEEGHVVPPAITILTLSVAGGLIAVHTVIHAIIDAYFLATGRRPEEIAPVA